jgi:hypothetical protein
LQPPGQERQLALVTAPQSGQPGPLELSVGQGGDPVAVADEPADRDHQGGGGEQGQEQQQAGPLGQLLDLAPAGPGHVPEKDKAAGPQQPAGGVVDGEGAVVEPGHAGQPGDEGAQGGGEAAEEHRWAAPLGQVAFGSVQVVAGDQAADRAVQQPPSPAAPHQVADAVADDGPGHRGPQDRGEGGAVLEGQHPA